jgi:hypothetical protein
MAIQVAEAPLQRPYGIIPAEREGSVPDCRSKQFVNEHGNRSLLDLVPIEPNLSKLPGAFLQSISNLGQMWASHSAMLAYEAPSMVNDPSKRPLGSKFYTADVCFEWLDDCQHRPIILQKVKQ